MRCGVVKHSEVWCGGVWWSMVRCGVVRCGEAW